MVDDYLKALDLYGVEPGFELLSEIAKRHVATFPLSSVGSPSSCLKANGKMGSECFVFWNEARVSSTCKCSKMEIISHCIGLNLRNMANPIVSWGIFFSHRHPVASFVNHLVVARILSGETRSLRDLEYCVIKELSRESTIIGSPEQLREVLVSGLWVNVSEEEAIQLYEGLLV
ncbi:MAG: hypothetical protein GY780_07680 [bacterium]|nr:hypothetical protein [bacterium]